VFHCSKWWSIPSKSPLSPPPYAECPRLFRDQLVVSTAPLPPRPDGPRAHWGKWRKPQGKGKGKGKGWGGEDWNRGWGATPSFGKGKGKGWGKGKGKGWGDDDTRAAAAPPPTARIR